MRVAHLLDNIGERPVLWWSGGLESTLLLAMLRENGQEFDIVQMREGWTRTQKKKSDELIIKWNLKVFSFPPSNVTLVGNLTAVMDYAGTPMLKDVIEGTQCLADIGKHTMHQMPFQWDCHIVGSREEDRHFDRQIVFAERWDNFYAPLFKWTRDEVKEALRERGLDDTDADEQSDTGNLSACHNCVKGTGQVWCPADKKYIDSVVWNPDDNLQQFLARWN